MALTPRQKFLAVVLIGWLVPAALIVAAQGNWALALAAVPIAWWHGHLAARLEAKGGPPRTPRSPPR